MQRSLVLSVSAMIMISAANAAADSPRLKGTYGFTGSDACLYSRVGFDQNLRPIDGTWSTSLAISGTRTFDGDGTGNGQNFTVGIVVPPTPGFAPSANSTMGSVSFTYVVNADGSFTSDNVPGTNVGTFLSGPRVGQTFLVENMPTITGLISKDGKTLTVTTRTPGVETQTFSDGTVERRICHRSRVFIKQQTDDDR